MYQLLSYRSIIELTGINALQFLQNLVTNDITKNAYCYSYILSNQGKYLFDFFIFKINEQNFLIDICSSQVKVFITKLMFYKLRAAVDIKINDTYKVIYSRQPLETEALYSEKDPRYNYLGFRSLVQNSKKISNLVEDDLYMDDKYEFAIPDGYSDLIYNKSIPIEYGAEELNGLNYEKGCYIGQEFISRTKYQGVIRKKIFKIIADTDLTTLPTGTELKIGENAIGISCSYYKNNGIALVREENYLEKQDAPITIENCVVELVIPRWRQM